MPLVTAPNLPSYDDFYEALIAMHQGLSTAHSHALNARLVLLLSNHIGEQDVLLEAFQIARAGAANEHLAVQADVDQVVIPVTPVHAMG